MCKLQSTTHEAVRPQSVGYRHLKRMLLRSLPIFERPIPVVINLSHGTIAGPHDGTSHLECAIDDIVAFEGKDVGMADAFDAAKRLQFLLGALALFGSSFQITKDEFDRLQHAAGGHGFPNFTEAAAAEAVEQAIAGDRLSVGNEFRNQGRLPTNWASRSRGGRGGHDGQDDRPGRRGDRPARA